MHGRVPVCSLSTGRRLTHARLAALTLPAAGGAAELYAVIVGERVELVVHERVLADAAAGQHVEAMALRARVVERVVLFLGKLVEPGKGDERSQEEEPDLFGRQVLELAKVDETAYDATNDPVALRVGAC